jgi:hypothetical protein
MNRFQKFHHKYQDAKQSTIMLEELWAEEINQTGTSDRSIWNGYLLDTQEYIQESLTFQSGSPIHNSHASENN